MYFLLFFALVPQDFWGPLVILSLFLAAFTLWLLFPSTGKIFPLARDILRKRSGRSKVPHLAIASYAPSMQDHGDLEFVSHLMELASRELASIHLTHSNPQSHSIRVSIFFSHMISALLAVSIFVLIAVTLLSILYQESMNPGTDLVLPSGPIFWSFC